MTVLWMTQRGHSLTYAPSLLSWQDLDRLVRHYWRQHVVKFRIERDTLADAVAWTARSLPTRPTVSVPAFAISNGFPKRVTSPRTRWFQPVSLVRPRVPSSRAVISRSQ